jgi:hypothetical protein
MISRVTAARSKLRTVQFGRLANSNITDLDQHVNYNPAHDRARF